MNQDIAIKVENLSKSFEIPQEMRNTIRERVFHFTKKIQYETYQAITDISFEIRRGEFFSIIGRNGSGKSTLLKILAGIYTPDTGSVVVNGEISPFLELGVGFNPELSGKDNIYLNGTILGLTSAQIDKKYHKIVEFSELERFIHLKVKNYSSGMQVRLAFTVAINANKEILLMDEVLAVGDANFQVKCFNVFEDFIKQGKTIIFVSHDPSSVQRYSDRVLYLESGKPSFIGPPAEALSRYMYTDVIKEKSPSPFDDPNLLTGDLNASVEELIVLQNLDDQSTSDSQGPDETKIIELISIQVTTNEGTESPELVHGDPFWINITFRSKKELEDLIFGITIYDQKKRAIFSTTTFSEKIQTGKISIGRITISFKILNYFSAGKYDISMKVTDATQKIFYLYKDSFLSFRVTNIKRLVSYEGVDLPHEIFLIKD